MEHNEGLQHSEIEVYNSTGGGWRGLLRYEKISPEENHFWDFKIKVIGKTR